MRLALICTALLMPFVSACSSAPSAPLVHGTVEVATRTDQISSGDWLCDKPPCTLRYVLAVRGDTQPSTGVAAWIVAVSPAVYQRCHLFARYPDCAGGVR